MRSTFEIGQPLNAEWLVRSTLALEPPVALLTGGSTRCRRPQLMPASLQKT